MHTLSKYVALLGRKEALVDNTCLSHANTGPTGISKHFKWLDMETYKVVHGNLWLSLSGMILF